MENWQFLIQKQGDRSWRPLESPNEEFIVEGRYRVVARSNRRNTDVEVRVIHTSILEMPPKRRIQKRTRRTTSEGLIAVIPFTYLKPGTWELRCSGDLMSDLLGTSWQYNVQLQVIPKVGGHRDTDRNGRNGIEIGEPYVSSSPPSDSLGNEEAIIEQPVNPVWLQGETAEQILQNLIDLALPPSESSEEENTVKDSLENILDLPLLLTIAQDTYITRWGENLTINGYVELKDKTNLADSQKSNHERIYSGELRIELHSPQSSELIRRVRQSLPENLIPFPIRSSIEIPVDIASKLLLADISLYGTFTADGTSILLAKESFTIAADVTELLELSAAVHKSELETIEDTQKSSTQPIDSRLTKQSTPLDLELFNLVKAPKTEQAVIVNPSPKKTLPPIINRRSLRRSSPQLPRFTLGQNKIIAPDDVVAEATPNQESLDKDSTIAVSRIVSKDTTFPYLKRIKTFLDYRQENKQNRLELFSFQKSINSQQVITENDRYLSHLATENPQLIPDSLYEQATAQVQEISSDEQSPQLVGEDTQTPSEYSSENITQLKAENRQFLENTSTEFVVPQNSELTSSELIVTGDFYTSPLIRKWMQSQGYSIPEPINLESKENDTYAVSNQEQVTQEETLLPQEENTILQENRDINQKDSEEQKDTETREQIVTASGFEVESEPQQQQTQTLEEQENGEFVLLSESPTEFINAPVIDTAFSQTSSLPYQRALKTWLSKEIVVDDTFEEPEGDTTTNYPSQQEEHPTSDSSISLPTAAVMVDPLPVPQLHLPKGELVSGKSVRVRVLLNDRRSQLTVKLWVEDCQTRLLIDGPRLLTNMLPTALGDLEEITHINVPFGCLEIRLEAITVDMVTQQESDKVTIHRSVVPPDLPSLQPDELLEI